MPEHRSEPLIEAVMVGLKNQSAHYLYDRVLLHKINEARFGKCQL
jgi:hypothetical protein